MTLSRTTITKNTIGAFNFFDEVMAMTKKDEFQQTSSISSSSYISSSSSNSMNSFQEVEQEINQEYKRAKRSRDF